MTGDDDADSLLRAIAAAPAEVPVRTLTAMVLRASDDAPAQDQWNLVRPKLASAGRPPEDYAAGLLAVCWTGAEHAERAATCALELRQALPRLGIALATGKTEPGRPLTPLVDRAVELLDPLAATIRVDEDTAARIERRLSLRRSTGEPIVLDESAASDTASRVGSTVGSYKIVRLLGAGGMGVVYLAEHLVLGRKAVIKLVREPLADRAELAARFFSEAKLAASIHHAGIVDVFDFGHDESGQGYLGMEYLDGETLRERLRREPRVPIELAVAVAAQVASAVGAAHGAGIVHRDLKPDNIFLVRDGDAPHGVRAKVLDFGLAKLATPTERGLTQSGNFIGTPLYMSPEQCRGRTVDARTDVYSLGCILFEMVCGRPPFDEDTVGDLIIAHGAKPPPPPRSLAPELSVALERAIVRMLAKAPDERPPDMASVGAELATLAVTVRGRKAGAARPERRSRWPRLAVIGGALLVCAAIGMAVVAPRVHSRHAVKPLLADTRRSIAVIDPRNESGGADSAWLATALADIVTTNLLAANQLTVAASTDVARMKADLRIGDAETWSREQLQKVRTDLDSEYVVAGSYRLADGRVRVDVRIYETATGRVVGTASGDGETSDLPPLGARLARDIERGLGVDGDGDAAAPAAFVLPSRPTAARYYAEALARLRRYEILPARDLLQKAAADDPADPLIHAALAETWRTLGYDANAAAEAKLAYEHGSQLPKENRLAIEAQYRESLEQWDQAIDAYRTLVDFFPTRIDYGLALAAAQTRAGDAKSAYATLDALRKLPQLGGDPRIEIAEAEAAETADDMERERQHAERAVALARPRGARVLLARALFHEGWALWVLGRDADAKRAYDEARRIFTDLHDGSGLARCLNNIGLAAHRDRRVADAAKAFDEALRLATDVGDITAQEWVLQNWSYILIDEGELGRALDLAKRKLSLGDARGDTPAGQAAAHANIAEILFLGGDLAGAKEHADTANDLLRGVDERSFAAFNNEQLGEIARVEDDLAGARKELQLAIRWSQGKHPMVSGECRLALARVELAASRPADAEKLTRDAIADLHEAGDTRHQACAAALLVTSLLARDRAADAAREAGGDAAAPEATLACRLDLEVARARLLAADGARRPAALAAMHDVASRAAEHGYVQRKLEIELAAAELGDDPRPLAREAAAKGFKQVARRARELAKRR